MKCPNCGEEMEMGELFTGIKSVTWAAKKLSPKQWFKMLPKVQAWRCPKCKKVELVTE